jgi:hypothetical protein
VRWPLPTATQGPVVLRDPLVHVYSLITEHGDVFQLRGLCAAVVLGVLVPPDEEVLTQLPRDLCGLTVLGNLLRGQDLRSAELTVRLIVHGDGLTTVDQPEIFRDTREFRGQRGLCQIDDADEFLAPASPARAPRQALKLRCRGSGARYVPMSGESQKWVVRMWDLGHVVRRMHQSPSSALHRRAACTHCGQYRGSSSHSAGHRAGSRSDELTSSPQTVTYPLVP